MTERETFDKGMNVLLKADPKIVKGAMEKRNPTAKRSAS